MPRINQADAPAIARKVIDRLERGEGVVPAPSGWRVAIMIIRALMQGRARVRWHRRGKGQP